MARTRSSSVYFIKCIIVLLNKSTCYSAKSYGNWQYNFPQRVIECHRISTGILVKFIPYQPNRIRLYIPANAWRIVLIPVLAQPRFRIKVLPRQPQVDLRRRGQVDSGFTKGLAGRLPCCLSRFI